MSNKAETKPKDERDSYHQTYAAHKDKRRTRRARKGHKT